MKAETFLKQFGHLADAPNGVQKLRELVLQLAVRGRLVQPTERNCDSEGEPQPSRDDVPHNVPSSWHWRPFADVVQQIAVGSRKVKQTEYLDSGPLPVVDQGKTFIAGYTDQVEKRIAIPGPVIVFGDHTKAIKLIDFDFVGGADGIKVLYAPELAPRYFLFALRSLDLDDRGYGRHFRILSQNLLPIPPLAEQHRIVAKVDELLALCDELEDLLRKREFTRDRLLSAAIAALLKSSIS